ncbi:MAG TPA: FAD-dependent oxidoreductase [Acidimicrobiales bacterium]|nr:FAD-dependent oxidoreductase [Acidimicrobiales bacterium]
MIDQAAVPDLDDAELAQLEPYGTRRVARPGEYLYRAGDADYDFYVVLSGLVEIVLGVDGEEQVIVQHGARRFLGELNLLTGLRVFVSARVAETSEVLQIPVEEFRRIIATQPQLSDKILVAFMARRNELLTGAGSATRVIGSRFSPDVLQLREFLSRTRIPYEWLDPDEDPHVRDVLGQFGLESTDLPVVVSSDTVLRRATPGSLAQHLGLTVDRLPERCFDLVIVGGGPAGLAAAVYGSSEGLRTLGVDMVAPGGQAGTSSRIENYFGFPIGISGGELAQRGFVQAEKFGAQLTTPCEAVSLKEKAGHLVVELSDGSEVAGRAVIAATGAHYRRLAVERIREFEAKGVYYAATELEARQCAGSPVVVVGGGNSAGQAAVFLADKGSPVAVVIRGSQLSASMSGYLVRRLEEHPHIDVLTDSQVVDLEGAEVLSSVQIEGPGGRSGRPCSALFSFIGADPQSDWLSGCAALDEHGFVLTDRALAPELLERDGVWSALGRAPLPYETSHPGLFAVGDVRSGSAKRVATAVGEGSAAVRAIHEYLAFTPTPVDV